MNPASPSSNGAAPPSAEHPNPSLPVPAELIEAVAERAAALVVEQFQAEPDPWIGVAQAAEHLACPPSRLYALVSARRVPHERDGSRLLFRRSQLDAWVANGGAKRP